VTKKRRPGRRDPRRAGRPLPATGTLEVLSRAQTSIRGEIEHIVERALEGDGRIVTRGGLVFFSTDTQDAWMLDAEDAMAAQRCRGGSVQASPIVEETADRFSINWPLNFRIDGEVFVTQDRNTGRLTSVLGYPVEAIAAALDQALAALEER